MSIRICGHDPLIATLRSEPKQHDAIFISNPEGATKILYENNIPELVREYVPLLYHDVEDERGGNYIVVQPYHVNAALEFYSTHKDLIVACHAGVSRSSATAYLLRCTEVSPEEAFDVLDGSLHFPNLKVIEVGAEILSLPDIVELVREWRNRKTVERYLAGNSL